MTFGAHLNKHIEYHGKIIENPVIILIRAKNIGNAFLKFVGVPAWRDWSTSPETTMISTVSAFTKSTERLSQSQERLRPWTLAVESSHAILSAHIIFLE